MEEDAGCCKAEEEATELRGRDRKRKFGALGPHFYNQPYDLEHAKIRRLLGKGKMEGREKKNKGRRERKSASFRVWQESWHRATNIPHASLKGLRWGTE